MKLVSKKRINSKYVKKHDFPKTPYQRLIALEHITEDCKQSLTDVLLSLNLFTFKKKIESKHKIIFNVLQKPSL